MPAVTAMADEPTRLGLASLQLGFNATWGLAMSAYVLVGLFAFAARRSPANWISF